MWIYIHGWKRNYLQALLLRTFARRGGKEEIKNNTELRKGFSIRDLYSKNEWRESENQEYCAINKGSSTE